MTAADAGTASKGLGDLRNRFRRGGGELERSRAVIAAGPDPDSFARAGARAPASHIGADLTTLSNCDLLSGRRHVIGEPVHALGGDALAAFDRHFREHPLVRFHAGYPQGGAHRITDSLSAQQFRRTPLYDEYYRSIGIAHAVAVPLYVDGTRPARATRRLPRSPERACAPCRNTCRTST